jgi:hypothetical protein
MGSIILAIGKAARKMLVKLTSKIALKAFKK